MIAEGYAIAKSHHELSGRIQMRARYCETQGP